MSSQSGIIPSEELIAQFHEFVNTGRRCLILSIDPTRLVIDIKEDVPAGSNVNNDLDHISKDLLNETECLYLIMRYDDSERNSGGKYAFISYVPDNAAVRYKMLYASTRISLLRALGSGGEVFDPILFINSREELDSDGWSKILTSIKDEAPLTESEINLRDVKENELIINNSTLSNARKLVSDSNTALLFQLDSKLEEVLKNEKTVESLLSLEIDNEVLKLSKASTNIPISALVSALEHISNGPAYHLYVSAANRCFFILTCPSGSKVKDRMVYATNKQGLLTHLKSLGWDFFKVIEIGDASELEIGDLQEAEKVKTESSSLRFAKPKGPRRR